MGPRQWHDVFFKPGLDGTPLPPPPAQSCVSSAGQLFKTVYRKKRERSVVLVTVSQAHLRRSIS